MNTEINTLKDLTKLIRKEIKDAGYTAKQVSVSGDKGSTSWAIKMTVKDIVNVDRVVLKNIVDKYQHVDFDDQTGDILEGGNTYINIVNDYDAEHDLAKSYYDAIRSFVEETLVTFNTEKRGTFYTLQCGALVLLDIEKYLSNGKMLFTFNDGSYGSAKVCGMYELALEFVKMGVSPEMVK